jgi:hypothetical protein
MALRDLIERARKQAEARLPESVRDLGRRLGREVAARAPAPVADALERLVGTTPPEAAHEPASAATPTSPPAPAPVGEAPVPASGRTGRAAVLDRVHAKADAGLKPEDRLVVVYFTQECAEDVARIRELVRTVETTLREMDLRREPPQTERQLAQQTGVMVPPWVYINGRYWGGRYEIESLAATGDLEPVIAARLDELGPEARRIGRLQEVHSDEISVDNVLARWRLGHILCVDDLDAWFEVDRDGTERFFHQGGSRPVEDMPAVAAEIVRAVEAGEYEAVWLLEPSVALR